MKIFTFLLCILPSVSFAINVNIEPYLQLTPLGETDYIPRPASLNGIGDFSGTAIGARLGAKFMGIGLGLDYSTGSYNTKDRFSTINQGEHFDLRSIGAYISYSVMNFRLLFAYLFEANVVTDGDNYYEGDENIKLSVGHQFKNNLNLAVEYQQYDLHSISPAGNSSFDIEGMMSLSISYPFSIY